MNQSASKLRTRDGRSGRHLSFFLPVRAGTPPPTQPFILTHAPSIAPPPPPSPPPSRRPPREEEEDDGPSPPFLRARLFSIAVAPSGNNPPAPTAWRIGRIVPPDDENDDAAPPPVSASEYDGDDDDASSPSERRRRRR